MNDFTASNGVRVVDLGGKWDQSLFQFTGEIPGLVDEIRQVREVNFQDPDLIALRQFFQAEADERLGRWRWPENPDFIVYLRENGSVTVFEESMPTAALTFWKNLGATGTSSGKYMAAARAYFDAHPEPKPWHDAEPGEGWLLTIDGNECAAVSLPDPNDVFGGVKFETAEFGLFGRMATAITAGRRFWPEASA